MPLVHGHVMQNHTQRDVPCNSFCNADVHCMLMYSGETEETIRTLAPLWYRHLIFVDLAPAYEAPALPVVRDQGGWYCSAHERVETEPCQFDKDRKPWLVYFQFRGRDE